jgi:hypothetical protein
MTSSSHSSTLESLEADIARTRARIAEAVRRVDHEAHLLMNPDAAPPPIKDGSHRLDGVDAVAMALRASGYLQHWLAVIPRERRVALALSGLAAMVLLRRRYKTRGARRLRATRSQHVSSL